MSIIRPLVVSKKMDLRYYYIPGLDDFFKGFRSVKIDFDTDDEGAFIKIRPVKDLDVMKYPLSELIQ